MNTTLERNIQQADGRYLEDLELKPLQDFIDSYPLRLDTYSLLQKHSEQLIVQALRKIAQTDRETIQQHGDKCKRDMSYVVQTIANCILKDDETAFNEQLVLWMQNIMSALQKEEQSARAYRAMQGIVKSTFPVPNATLINRYLELFIAALTTGSKAA